MRLRLLIGVGALLAASTITATADRPVQAATPPAGFTDTFVAAVDRATAVEWLPSDQIVVLEQRTGRVRVATPGGAFETALDLAVCGTSERGVLGLTADPAFLGNGWVYVFYTAPAGSGCVNRVSRFTMVGSTIDPSTEIVLLDNIASTGGNHNGGDLDFDGAGNLLVAIGDAGTDPRGNSGAAGSNDAAQDLSLLNGKIVRITRTGLPAPGNPFSGAGTTRCAFSGTSATPSTTCQEIYASGLRNPYRIAVDRNDGAGRFFINDVGQGTFEEVNLGQLGANYGWPAREGACPQGRSSDCSSPAAGLTDPITSYGRSLGTYVTAGAFVPSGLWPAEYDGAYLFGDGGSGRIWVRHVDGSLDYGAPFATDAYGLTDMTFGFDADGVMVLYYVEVGGGLRMISPASVAVQTAETDLEVWPTTPFRAYDTGDGTGAAAGDVLNGTTRMVDLDPPPGTKAAFVNLTYDATYGPGFIRTWAARTLRPGTSALNADRAGTTVANAAVVALADDGSFMLESFTTGRVIVDVMAWFVETDGEDVFGFVPLEPARVVDTREPTGQTLASGSTNPWTRSGDDITIAGSGQLGIPDDDTAVALVISVGAIPEPGVGGYVGAYPTGGAYPGASNVNVLPGEIRSNMMIVPLGEFGRITLRAFNVSDVVVDILGYIDVDAPGSPVGLFNTIDPTRTVDTRIPLGFPTLSAETPRTGATPPATAGATAIVQNVTATGTSAPGFVATFPGAEPPEVSNVNFDGSGQTRAALAFTTTDGNRVSYVSLVATDLVVDVVGYFSD